MTANPALDATSPAPRRSAPGGGAPRRADYIGDRLIAYARLLSLPQTEALRLALEVLEELSPQGGVGEALDLLGAKLALRGESFERAGLEGLPPPWPPIRRQSFKAEKI
ncbi:MAG: hypothetical protein LBO66_09585 [Deltaproteobacteria bacterium]|jgi:hypothetical protein|nr:hypothetical protein [Deltaproteobacteria bacterium]